MDDVSLDIRAGETLGLVGESGSGKSTLGRLVLRLIEPSSGSVRFAGRDLLAASHREMRRLRRDMQIIFQDPFGSLDPRMNVDDIISEPLVIHEAMSLTARRVRVSELLSAVGLDQCPTSLRIASRSTSPRRPWCDGSSMSTPRGSRSARSPATSTYNGVQTPTDTQQVWSSAQLGFMLRNTGYAGTAAWYRAPTR